MNRSKFKGFTDLYKDQFEAFLEDNISGDGMTFIVTYDDSDDDAIDQIRGTETANVMSIVNLTPNAIVMCDAEQISRISDLDCVMNIFPNREVRAL